MTVCTLTIFLIKETYGLLERRNFKQEYTYIWNKIDSFDNILRGWIPYRLVNLLRRHMKRVSKSFIKNLLIKWLGKIDKLFFNMIWKQRNEDMLLWEETQGISKKLKRSTCSSKPHPRSKKEIRNSNKITYSGKKKASVHILDETLDSRIRILFGLNRLDFLWVSDKKIAFKLLDLIGKLKSRMVRRISVMVTLD